MFITLPLSGKRWLDIKRCSNSFAQYLNMFLSSFNPDWRGSYKTMGDFLSVAIRYPQDPLFNAKLFVEGVNPFLKLLSHLDHNGCKVITLHYITLHYIINLITEFCQLMTILGQLVN